MILDTYLIRLEAVLAGAVAANQPEVHVDYIAWNNTGLPSKPAAFRVALNGNTDVTILAAPAIQGIILEPTFVSIYNKDTASVTVTVKTDDGTTERIIAKATLATLEVLMYEKGTGWYVMAANGAIKQTSGISGPGSSTNNGMVRWDGTSGTAVKDTSDITYDGTTYIIGASKFTVASATGNTLVGGNLTVSGTGPHVIGGATDANTELLLTGTFAGSSLARALLVNTTLTPAANGAGSGVQVAPTINKASSGTHADFASLRVEPPTIGAGAATLTNAATLKVTDAPSVGTNKYDIWCASTTAGAHRFDGGTTGAQTATFAATNKPGSGTTSPDTWLPVTIDGTLHYIPAFL